MVKSTKSRYVPYVLNPVPNQSIIESAEWRRNNAISVDTEIVKPESFLPVTTGSSGRSPICFTIKSIPQSRVDGKNIFIEVSFIVERYNSQSKWVQANLDDDVIPIANTYCSMFEDVNVSFNGVLVENTQRDFAIKAYTQNLLFTTEQDRQTWMNAGMQALDKFGQFRQVFDKKTVTSPDMYTTLHGHWQRRKAVENTGNVVYGRLLSDVLSCSEPLPDTVTINVKMFPAKSEACLVQTMKKDGAGVKEEAKQYRIKITDCSLYVPRITGRVSTNIARSFCYTNWRILAYTHQTGQTNFKKDVAIGETLPQKAIVVFMSEKAYNGNWEYSKLAFEKANVASVLMKCNHRHVPFSNGYQMDWNNHLYNTAYVGLTTELGARGHQIKYDGFDNGYSIYGFDLTPNKTGDVSLHSPLRGALELGVQFEPAPVENLMVIVMLIYADKFTINKAGTFALI